MMKNKFLVLMILGIVFITSCSDDDDKDSPKDFNGIYSTTSTERVLDLRYSDAVFIGKSVDFNSADGKSATLKLQGVVPGESETVFSDVQLVENNSVYTFVAENKNDVRTVALEGSIVKGKLTVDVDVKFVQNELMKKWKLSTVKMTWLPKDYYLVEGKLNTGGVATLLSLGGGMLLKQYLQDVAFLEDGNIVATYNAAVATDENPEPDADWRLSELNLAHYYVKDDICYVYPNVEMIMQQVEADKIGRSTGSDPMLSLLEQLLTGGIPVYFEITKGTGTKADAIYMYLNEVLLKSLKPLIPFIGGLVPGDYEIPILKVPMQPIIDNLPGALDVTTELKVGLKCNAIE